MRASWRGLLGFVFLVILIALVLTPTRWGGTPHGIESFLGIGRAMFQTYLLPFEALSILLLAALIGAVYLAKRDGPDGETGGPGEHGGHERGSS